MRRRDPLEEKLPRKKKLLEEAKAEKVAVQISILLLLCRGKISRRS